MSKKAGKSTPGNCGKSRKFCSESTKSNSSGYDYAGRIRKCCVSWSECVQKWDSVNATGLELATKIVNEQLQNSSSEQDDVGEVSSNFADFDDDDATISDKENLVKSFDSLKDIHKKMSSLTSNFEAIGSLREMKETNGRNEQPVFDTWPLENYVNLSRKLASMFEQELRLKKRLVAMVLQEATVDDRSKLMACLAMWLHQPYLYDNYKHELDLLFLETGLRTS